MKNKKRYLRQVCQLFCVNDQVLFLGDGVQGKGVNAPSPAH